MRLRLLRLSGFRNLEPQAFEPGPAATVLFGDNGQGKTNLLEAAHVLCELRSFRSKRAEELVGWGQPGAQLQGEVEAAGLVRRLEVALGGDRKIARVDGKAVRRDAEVLRGIGVVLFVPEDLLLPKAAPSARRSFIDRAAFGVDRLFYREAVAFQRVLKSRNAVLKRGEASPALLGTYDEELARTGARVIVRRRALVAALAPRVTRLYQELHADLGLRVLYRGHEEVRGAATEAAVRDALVAGLERRRALDLRRGFTGFGPQTDDLELELLGHPAREHGSQGQLRSLVLALKLAELETLAEVQGEAPLLLLDDVASELDGKRREKLFERLASLAGQSLITMTDRTLLPLLPGRVDYEVVGGRLRAA